MSVGTDIFARFLNSTGHFRGKVRLADLLGRLTCVWNGGRGTFPLVQGTSVKVDLKDRVQRLMWGGAYEPHVRKCLVTILRPGDTFVDIGAHIGFFSMIASSLVGAKGKVYAFEANSNLFETLQANASEYSWLVPSLRAVWSENGRVAFSDPLQPGESGWGKLASIRNEGNEVLVEAVSLDEWHASVGFPVIRAIKIDAEGSEPFILEGARRLIACTRPILIIELNDELLREVGKSKEAVIASLRDQGYLICGLAREMNKKPGNAGNPLSPEVLCLPSEQVEEARKTMSNLHLEVVADPSS
jgi:FkbM family methyltransferase